MLAKGGIKIVSIPLLFSLLFLILLYIERFFIIPLVISLLMFAFFIYFFRDMPRKIGEGIISPADGKIIETDGKIAIFMGIFDMHVNLCPYGGKIVSIKHVEGKHEPAYRARNNERVEIVISTSIGEIKVIQIAGIFARRIVTYVKEGETVEKGEKIGMIRFGSRVEIYLPNCKIVVRKGMRVKAGETIAIL